MEIRPMKIEDIPNLAALYRQFWNEDSCVEKMSAQFLKLQSSSTHIFLAATEQGHLIGSVMGVVCEELYGQCRPFLVVENMIVDTDHRKKGGGKALMTELQQAAIDRGCTQMILVTETNRLDACRFYESVGFHPLANKGYKKKL